MNVDFCLDCFSPVSGSVCTVCGKDWSGYETSPIVLSPGRIVAGRYKIGKVLGIGGFGVTYICQDMNSKNRYAVKEYMPGSIATRKADGCVTVVDKSELAVYQKGLDMFLYETNILITLSGCSSIVEAVNFVMDNNTGYLIMEYIDGISASKYLKSKSRMDQDFALSILSEVSRALKVVHSKGLLHRDISPDNIMLARDGRVKLIDFGASRYFVGERSKSLSLILKPGYAPPEQYSSKEANQGEWTDIYALAATYYKMVTGINPPESLERLNCDRLEPLETVVPGIKRHISKAIEKAMTLNFKNRYKNIDKFISDMKFDHSGSSGYIPTPPPQPIPRPTPPQQQPVSRPVPPPQQPVKAPYIKIYVNGREAGTWRIQPGVEVFIGRDSSVSNIAVMDALISRKHCGIMFNSQRGDFVLKDYSSNGTLWSDGTRMNRTVPYILDAGMRFMLATSKHIVEVGIIR